MLSAERGVGHGRDGPRNGAVVVVESLGTVSAAKKDARRLSIPYYGL